MAEVKTRGMSYMEKQIMLDAARGLTAQQSAKKHGCTLVTMQERRRLLRQRLDARNIAHAVALTIAYGYITREEIMEGSQT